MTFALLLDAFLEQEMDMPDIEVLSKLTPPNVSVGLTGTRLSAILAGDTTRFYMQVSANKSFHVMNWSQYYKGEVASHHCTSTLLGGVVHCSDAYPGSTSDDDIITRCGVLDKMVPGMVYLLDRGYLRAMFQASLHGVVVKTPAFLARGADRKNVSHLTSEQAQATLDVASPRNVIERVFGRVKSTWPWIMRVQSAVRTDVHSAVVRSCLRMTNFFGPLSNAAAENE